jgi:hypothetical protein
VSILELIIHWYSLSEDFFERIWAIRARASRLSFSFLSSNVLKKIIEERYFCEGGPIVISKVYGRCNVFSQTESIHDVFEVDIAVREMFRVIGTMGRGCRGSRSLRHFIGDFTGCNGR